MFALFLTPPVTEYGKRWTECTRISLVQYMPMYKRRDGKIVPTIYLYTYTICILFLSFLDLYPDPSYWLCRLRQWIGNELFGGFRGLQESVISQKPDDGNFDLEQRESHPDAVAGSVTKSKEGIPDR